jgi:hypothetical protein
MKKSILAIYILLSYSVQASNFTMKLENESYVNRITIENKIVEETSHPSPDTEDKLHLLEVTDSHHVLGAGWHLFSEGVVSDFGLFTNFEDVINSNHIEFTIYNSDNLYLTFNRSLTTRDGSNAHGKPYWLTSTATIINTSNKTIGNTVHYVNYPTVSGLVFSNVTSAPWCSPINGRYNGGCANGSVGVGDWKIFVR